MTRNDNKSQIVLFELSDGVVTLDAAIDVEKDEVWLNRSQMSILFDRDGKTYQVEYYNLDVIISIGYRVKSQRGVEFRRWV